MATKGNKKTIALIEDEEVLVNLLIKKLEQDGYEVKAAYDGVAGLELIHTQKPDLVLLDMMLPRLSGFGVLEKLNEEKLLPGLPVMIISNSGQPIEIDRAKKLGIRDYLIKVNFDLEEVITKVNIIFNALKDKRADPAQTNAARVLIVEDEVFLLELLERKFSQEGVKTFRAMDAETARAVLAREEVDGILLDVLLPGTDGITFLKELKADAKLNSIPVIIASNLGQKEEIQRGFEAGAIGYIIKANAAPADIVAKVKQLINR